MALVLEGVRSDTNSDGDRPGIGGGDDVWIGVRVVADLRSCFGWAVSEIRFSPPLCQRDKIGDYFTFFWSVIYLIGMEVRFLTGL